MSWNAVPGAARYELSTWWASDPGWQSLGGDSLTSTSYTHTDVTAGTTYYYSIRAVNAAGDTSDWLQEYPSATVPAAATPLTTPELTAGAVAGAVQLSWNAVPGAARYELSTWWALDPGWQSIGGNSLTGTSYTHTTVTAGTTYYYSIRAVNTDGETSAWLQPYPTATLPDPYGTSRSGRGTACPAPRLAEVLSVPQTCRRPSPSGTPQHLAPRPPQTKSAGYGPNTRIRRLRPLPPASSQSNLQHRKPCHSLLTPLHSLLAFGRSGLFGPPLCGGSAPATPPLLLAPQ